MLSLPQHSHPPHTLTLGLTYPGVYSQCNFCLYMVARLQLSALCIAHGRVPPPCAHKNTRTQTQTHTHAHTQKHTPKPTPTTHPQHTTYTATDCHTQTHTLTHARSHTHTQVSTLPPADRIGFKNQVICSQFFLTNR